jgi:hypothetical protein
MRAVRADIYCGAVSRIQGRRSALLHVFVLYEGKGGQGGGSSREDRGEEESTRGVAVIFAFGE